MVQFASGGNWPKANHQRPLRGKLLYDKAALPVRFQDLARVFHEAAAKPASLKFGLAWPA